jgi:hypothetical protein
MESGCCRACGGVSIDCLSAYNPANAPLGGTMIRAIAFHSSLALEKLHEYFADEPAQCSAVSIGTKCEKCGFSFAIVLPMKNDPKNQEYMNELNKMIAADCINGMHQEEYVLGRVH